MRHQWTHDLSTKMARTDSIPVLGLRVGDRVRVRRLPEILATLDDHGYLDGLPFMPEMARNCDRELTVLRRVEKVNDLADRSGLRRMRNAVILDGDRCNGAYHGGCQALCQSIWKEAWLNRIQDRQPRLTMSPTALPARAMTHPGDAANLVRQCQMLSDKGDRRFRCQQTELKNASQSLAWWDPRQYWRDWRSGNVTASQMIRMLLFWLFTLCITRIGGYRLLVSSYNRMQRLRGAEPYPYAAGTLQKTPTGKLDLQAGEWVQVKSHGEILATLDASNKNRGLWFDVEMTKYCGGKYRVLARVERIIDPKTGRMIEFTTDCIILDRVTTRGEYHRFYSQNEYPFWREIWLRRVTDPTTQDS